MSCGGDRIALHIRGIESGERYRNTIAARRFATWSALEANLEALPTKLTAKAMG
jgi:hypothetical protein